MNRACRENPGQRPGAIDAADVRILWQPTRPSLKKVEMAAKTAGSLSASLTVN